MIKVQAKHILINSLVSRFLLDRKGLAAIEFALILPMIFGALVWSSIVGTALLDKQDVAKKVRLGIEGIMRFDGDVGLATTFANSSGQTAFPSESQSSFNDSTVSITNEYRCRTISSVSSFSTLGSATCANPEIWYTVSASDTSLSPFGQQTAIGESITFLGN